MLPALRPTCAGRTTSCLGEKNAPGILVQLHETVLIAGIGINVNHTFFPPELADTATSLRLVTGREQNSERLLTNLVDAVDEHLENLLSERPRIGATRVLPGIQLCARPARHRRPEWHGNYGGHRRSRSPGIPSVTTG